MNMVSRGFIELDVPLSNYLQDIRIGKEHMEKEITLRMLLSHSAGLPAEYTPQGKKDECALEESMHKELPDVSLAYRPGAGYLYSNLGIRLASYVMQITSGKYYSQLLNEYVLLPLGMKRSTLDIYVAATFPFALPHSIDKNGNFHLIHNIVENAARLAAGGLYSNTEELSMLARCIMNGGIADNGCRVVDEALLSEMMRWHCDTKNSEGNGYGLGLLLMRHNNKILYGHTGSRPPYFGSFFCDIENGYGISVLMNSAAEGLSKKIPKTIIDYLAK